MYLNGTWKSKNDSKRLYISDFEDTQFSINDEKTCIIFNLLTNWSRKNILDDNVLEHSIKQSLERIAINERFLHEGKALFKAGRQFIWEYCLEKNSIIITEKSIQLFYFPTKIKHVDYQKFDITVILNIVFCDYINTNNSNI